MYIYHSSAVISSTFLEEIMPNEFINKLLAERDTNTEKIRQLNNRIKIFANRERDAERRERTHRLIEKGAIIESVIPQTIAMSSEEFKSFLIKLTKGNRPP